MHFSHHPALRARYPELSAGVLFARGVHNAANVESLVASHEATARERLAAVASESELPEVQAWRRAFARMGLKPTQYRCASESLLRRFRKEGTLPRIHPLIDFCNAVSLAFAIPVAVLDTAQVRDWLQVRHAEGYERYVAFGGEMESPDPGEVSFIDAAGQAHARRWTHRQSGLSAVREQTSEVLVVAEAMHAGGAADVERLVAAVAEGLRAGWGVESRSQLLTDAAPHCAF